jgi:hypothetical protein
LLAILISNLKKSQGKTGADFLFMSSPGLFKDIEPDQGPFKYNDERRTIRKLLGRLPSTKITGLNNNKKIHKGSYYFEFEGMSREKEKMEKIILGKLS